MPQIIYSLLLLLLVLVLVLVLLLLFTNVLRTYSYRLRGKAKNFHYLVLSFLFNVHLPSFQSRRNFLLTDNYKKFGVLNRASGSRC